MTGHGEPTNTTAGPSSDVRVFADEVAVLRRRVAELESQNSNLLRQLKLRQGEAVQARSEHDRSDEHTRTRLRLYEFAATHSLHDLLQETLDEAERLTDSCIGFYHFVDADQQALTLQAWSTRTVRDYCTAVGAGSHYSIHQAGVWVECVRQRRPVIHNDYANLAHKHGLPDGHAALVRELVVPIFRDDLVVAILGVGNKPSDYTDEDVRLLNDLANATWEIAQRKRAEDARRQTDAALKESKELFELAFNINPDAVQITRLRDGVVVNINDGVVTLTGFTREDIVDKAASDIHLWLDSGDQRRIIEELRRTGGLYNRETVLRHKNGSTLSGVVSAKLFSYQNEQFAIIVTRDVSALRKVEREHESLRAQLVQAQKMEAIGTLAGGVAHDFNNLITIIQVSADQGLEELGASHAACEFLNDIRSAAGRSAELTRKLLAFARKQTIIPRVLDLNQTSEGMLKMLKLLLGENLTLTWNPTPGLWPVLMDPTQLDQVLANLCVNARDAIADVGNVTIEMSNQSFTEEFSTSRGFLPGDYVRLSVSDNGCGMTAETQAHIFEPFFTTKGEGSGTGLGLATVYGIVKQNHGIIEVSSTLHEGTRFTIYLPRHTGLSSSTRAVRIEPTKLGRETILVVEDEAVILRILSRMLGSLGYNVLATSSPAEAARLAHNHQGPIDLLLTDVIMPEMNGRDLSKLVLEEHPLTKCLFMSGYTADIIAHHGVLDSGLSFIQKPFSVDSLATKLREVLRGSQSDISL